MKYTFIILATCLAVFGCSDDTTSPSGDASVSFSTTMSSSTVQTVSVAKKENIAASTVDSLKINNIRILISELKLHRDKEKDTVGNHKVKSGPLLLTLDATKKLELTSGSVPAGTYDKVKFEFHRFSSSEIAQYLNDAVFKDFVTDKRSTFIIEGMVYAGGVQTPFTYKSDATVNLSLNFDTPITLNSGTAYSVEISADPSVIFVKGKEILDPRDEKNNNDIDNAIKSAIKAMKK